MIAAERSPRSGVLRRAKHSTSVSCGYMWTFIPLLATSTAWWIIRVSASTCVLTPVIVSHSCIAITSSRPTLSWPSDNQQSGKERCRCIRGQHISPCVHLNDFSSGHQCLLLDLFHLVPQIAPPDDAFLYKRFVCFHASLLCWRILYWTLIRDDLLWHDFFEHATFTVHPLATNLRLE